MKLNNFIRTMGILAMAGLSAGAVAEMTLEGAGASFPAPLYQRWAEDFGKANPEVRVRYESVGSGAGVEQFIQHVVDFGASDAAMKDEEIARVEEGVLMLPATAGSVVLAYNLPGIAGLELPREVYPQIFLGEITKWDDPRIAEANPGIELPDMPITVVTRADESGTTFVFTQHLSAINRLFDSEVGTGKRVSWPTGVTSMGNEGVTATIKQTPGAIGYVEYGYAKANDLEMAALENKAGNFVAPSDASASATLASVTLPGTMRVWPTDPEGEEDYPIVTFSWLLVYKTYQDQTRLDAVKKFITYGLTEGQQVAPELGYVPLPQEVVDKVTAALETIEVKK